MTAIRDPNPTAPAPLFRNRAVPWLAATLLAALLPTSAQVSLAADVSPSKEIPVAGPDEAVVVLIREARFVGKARTMFVYADDSLLGTLDNDTWTAATVPPGEHTLWLNWAKVAHTAQIEAGKTHYFTIPMTGGFVELDEATGRALIDAVKGYASPTPKEQQTAEGHIRERYGKALKTAAKEPQAAPATGKGERERHIAQWPQVDLTAYDCLYVEDFEMSDPKAAERDKAYLVETAPGRLASRLVQNIPPEAFEVHRGKPAEPAAGSLVLRGRITQYKPGSEAARMMIAGAGAAKMDFEVQLLDAVSGEELASFTDERSYSWGGAMGAAGGIESIEQNLAYELALYLERAKGMEQVGP